ncbi:predicted protein [Uncinocarpus reesii 1704]|uniref:Uncharacterized protein n=1 Tax=Uncinocarpus reesii (strain UAMH 1704) TaxID=336963 RepID=C4JTB5_UNCRE|nr:uncharacterized protein UREG_05704 [Uncinocarpus reesii 1704]EEP80862.1 predicted protein [Uncinocarpus reesii 1704]
MEYVHLLGGALNTFKLNFGHIRLNVLISYKPRLTNTNFRSGVGFGSVENINQEYTFAHCTNIESLQSGSKMFF